MPTFATEVSKVKVVRISVSAQQELGTGMQLLGSDVKYTIRPWGMLIYTYTHNIHVCIYINVYKNVYIYI